MKEWKAIFTWGLPATSNTSSWGTTYMGLRVKRFTGFYKENAECKYSDISMTYSEQITFIFSLWNTLLSKKIRFTNWVLTRPRAEETAQQKPYIWTAFHVNSVIKCWKMVRTVNVDVCKKLQEPEKEAEVEWGEIDETKRKRGSPLGRNIGSKHSTHNRMKRQF